MRPALEVRLEGGFNTLLGWLVNHDPASLQGKMLSVAKARMPTLAEFDETFDDSSPSALVDTRVFKVGMIARCFQNIVLRTAVDEQEKLDAAGVPPYAKRFISPVDDSTRFVWPALLVDVDGHEWLFDLDEFEPADDKPYVDPSEGLTTIRWHAGLSILDPRKVA